MSALNKGRNKLNFKPVETVLNTKATKTVKKYEEFKASNFIRKPGPFIHNKTVTSTKSNYTPVIKQSKTPVKASQQSIVLSKDKLDRVKPTLSTKYNSSYTRPGYVSTSTPQSRYIKTEQTPKTSAGDSASTFNFLAAKLDDLIAYSSKPDSEEKLHSALSNKYSAYKTIFHELMQQLPQYSKVFGKLYDGYNHMFEGLIAQNNKLHLRVKQLENVEDYYESLKSKYKTMKIALDEKSHELTSIQKLVKEKSFTQNDSNISPMGKTEAQIYHPTHKNKSSVDFNIGNYSIDHTKLNDSILNDLDAIYFYDKVRVRNKSSHNKIPRLNIQKANGEENAYKPNQKLPDKKIIQNLKNKHVVSLNKKKF